MLILSKPEDIHWTVTVVGEAKFEITGLMGVLDNYAVNPMVFRQFAMKTGVDYKDRAGVCSLNLS